MIESNKFDGTNGNGYQPTATESAGIAVPPSAEDPARPVCGQSWTTAQHDAFNKALG